MVYSEAWQKRIYEKNLKSKISWRCPFKYRKLGIIDEKANYFHIYISTELLAYFKRRLLAKAEHFGNFGRKEQNYLV